MTDHEAYKMAHARAQRLANETGFDHGLEWNGIFKEWRVFMLPRRENRFGFETRCEVVSCESITKTQPGHGSAR